MKTYTYLTIFIVTLMMSPSCQPSKKQSPATDSGLSAKVAEYAEFTLTSDLSGLSDNERRMIPLLIEAASIMDDLFWKETYGDREELLSKHADEAANKFLRINYGPWERLNGDKPFLPDFGEKPAGAKFYPADMTRGEFEAFGAADKTSLYSMVIRDQDGKLATVPYHEFFRDEVNKASGLLKDAAVLAEDPGLKKYLTARAAALLNDDYYESDIAWMDMKSSNIDFVIGPIENYEDGLFGYKAAHEAFVLIKDREWSNKLARFAQLLPALQKSLPVPEDYKKEVPGSDSDLGVYDAVYYAGDCNCGSKTIAINLPNDERVQLEKGSRKLQLKNSIRAKFDKILVPIANELMNPAQMGLVRFDAFFENIMFHEVAHGLGIKNTLTGKGPVRQVLSDQYSALEEAKADILGLYLVSQLSRMGELGEHDMNSNYSTFIAGIFRSVRFGASSSHGKGNMLQFNYLKEAGAFVRDSATGTYKVDFAVMEKAVEQLAGMILRLQGDGDYEGVKALMAEKGVIVPALQNDLDRVNGKGIPRDIVFRQGTEVLGL